jgi:DNA-binding transcriptional MerR regulator
MLAEPWSGLAPDVASRFTVEDMNTADGATTVGALARATGVTVRALHHYDRLGLLRPARDAAGRRRYGPADVRRLHQIIVLRSFGLPLSEIAQLLDGTGADPRGLLRGQLRRTEEQLAALEQLRDTLLRIIAAWPAGGDTSAPATGQLIELIERTTTMTHKLTREQFEQLSRQRAEAMAALSPEQVAALQRQRGEQVRRLSPEELTARQETRRQMLPDAVA